jgi:hypothetical protein
MNMSTHPHPESRVGICTWSHISTPIRHVVMLIYYLTKSVCSVAVMVPFNSKAFQSYSVHICTSVHSILYQVMGAKLCNGSSDLAEKTNGIKQ